MQPHRQQELDNQWLESLLVQAYQPDTRSEDRIASVMQNLDQPMIEQVEQHARAPWYSLRNLSALAIAASLLVLATFVMDNSQQRAYATVARSAQAAPLVRHYRMQMLFQRPALGRRELLADLYIDPTNRFVLKHPGMMGFGTAWIGGDAQQRWIAPPRGPVIVGGEELVGRWLSNQDIASPALHLSSLLERMHDEYALTMLESVKLDGPNNQPIECTHVRGDILRPRAGLARTIELWQMPRAVWRKRLFCAGRPSPIVAGQLLGRSIESIHPQICLITGSKSLGHAPGRPIVRARTDQDIEQNSIAE